MSESTSSDDQLKLLLLLATDWLDGDREHAEEIKQLVSTLSPPVPGAPVNVDVPMVQQAGETVTCTMGNWTGEPTSYAYQWQCDGVDVVSGEASYTVTADDVGTSFACVVTATNAIGSTRAPPSNGVIVTAPAE